MIRNNILIKLVVLIVMGFTAFSCLEGDEMNTPPDASKAFLMATRFNGSDANASTGLEYFAAQTLLLNPTDEEATLTFAVAIQGVNTLDKDVDVQIAVDDSKLLDNIANDAIEYALLPQEAWSIPTSSATIKKGETFVEFNVTVHPTMIDFTQNYMLPIKITTNSGVTVSQNQGTVYYHIIGNPLAGLYSHDFIRYSNPAGTGDPDGFSFYGQDAVFAPADQVTINVPTGYYDHAPYIISWTDTDGVLTDFKVKFSQETIDAWTAAGITITNGPNLTVSEDQTTFTVKYTTLTRNVTDIYTKK